MPTFTIGVVLLAAGASSRMGRPKLLLPWGSTSVIGHSVRIWRSLGAAQIAAVCSETQPALEAELDQLSITAESRIINSSPQDGMFSSIQCAARWSGWNAGLTHWILSLGDQPHLRRASLLSLLEFGAAHPDHICQPAYRGHRRHPVLFPKNCFQQLGATDASHLKEFLRRSPQGTIACELDDPGLDFDIDTPEDYERAIKEFLPAP